MHKMNSKFNTIKKNKTDSIESVGGKAEYIVINETLFSWVMNYMKCSSSRQRHLGSIFNIFTPETIA